MATASPGITGHAHFDIFPKIYPKIRCQRVIIITATSIHDAVPSLMPHITLRSTNHQAFYFQTITINMSSKVYKLNKMAATVQKLESYLPTSMYSLGYTILFNSMVKLAATAGIKVEKLSQRESQVYLRNKRRVQNHIGGLHACSMALAAESATGMVVGMNVPDTHIPLLKSMHVNFVRRCQGNVRVKAWLTEEDYQRIHEDDKGQVTVPVRVEDESGNEPIETEMIWAWVNKNRSKK